METSAIQSIWIFLPGYAKEFAQKFDQKTKIYVGCYLLTTKAHSRLEIERHVLKDRTLNYDMLQQNLKIYQLHLWKYIQKESFSCFYEKKIFLSYLNARKLIFLFKLKIVRIQLCRNIYSLLYYFKRHCQQTAIVNNGVYTLCALSTM